ncbi:hypothetical protein N8501_01480 [Synechococcus sp. AH-601-N10]|nr:hypothetical protein [Synechococcus sp. AH-601-N10]
MSNTNPATALWLDEKPISGADVLNVLRIQGKISALVHELILNEAVSETKLDTHFQEELLNNFRNERNLESDEAFQDFLSKNHLTKALLLSMLSRPHKIVQYREERWGPRANSLYLKHKDRYDMVTYRRLQSSNADVMQEVFFRLKDQEDSWETMARQFPGAKPDSDARIGPIAVTQLEPAILEALRRSTPGTVLRPIRVQDQVIVVQLETFEASLFNEDLRTRILRDEFDAWLKDECSKMMSKLRYAP